MDLATFKLCIEAILLYIIIIQTIIMIGVMTKVSKTRISAYFFALYSMFVVIFTILKGWL